MQREANEKGVTIEAYLSDNGFNSEQISDILSGENKIKGYTWHHHQETGRMQLVNEKAHGVGHNGGNSLWGDKTEGLEVDD